MEIQYQRLSPHLGVEIVNLDCSKKISKFNLSIIKINTRKTFYLFYINDEKKLPTLQKLECSSLS